MTIDELRKAGWRFRFVSPEAIYARAPDGYDYQVAELFDFGVDDIEEEIGNSIASLLNGSTVSRMRDNCWVFYCKLADRYIYRTREHNSPDPPSEIIGSIDDGPLRCDVVSMLNGTDPRLAKAIELCRKINPDYHDDAQRLAEAILEILEC